MKNKPTWSVDCKGMAIGYPERSGTAVTIQKELSIHASPGEMVALIGSNGVGKSTLLRTIAGFQPSLTGDVLICGRSVSEYRSPELAKVLGFVSTENVRINHLTVAELAGLGRYPHTNWFGQLNETDHRVVADALRLTGLSGYEEKLISRISDGERQRAMIARVLAQQTEIIMLDEPTAFLDISNRYGIVHMLHEIALDQGKCVIFSTHDLHIALSLADRIWLMLPDRVAEGIPEEIASAGLLDAIFPDNPGLYFDPARHDFSFRRVSMGRLWLTASEKLLTQATAALTRIGFDVRQVRDGSVLPGSEEPGIRVIQAGENEPDWMILAGERSISVPDLETVCRTVRSLIPRPES